MFPYLEDAMIAFAVSNDRPRRTDSGPCPSYFRACCFEASHGHAHGQRVGYDHPGYHLTLHLEGEQPWDVENEDWEKAVDELAVLVRAAVDEFDDLVRAAAEEKIIDWFCNWLPRCMALVPRRRRKMFVKGVYRAAVHNEWIDELPDEA
jgi:hypothetical protein